MRKMFNTEEALTGVSDYHPSSGPATVDFNITDDKSWETMSDNVADTVKHTH